MAKKKYISMNQVPLGTKMIVKESGEEVQLVEIQNFPTTFIVKFDDGKKDKFLTHQVEILNWPAES
tara:strand:+ start:8698 stop:8895 length:198 start_codon:yes stop_codon:yes gene_type:complete